MFGHKKSPLDGNAKNPFDSDDECDKKQNVKQSGTSSQPTPVTLNTNTKPFDDDEAKGKSSSAYSFTTERNRFKNDFRDSGGLENQSVQELETYAVYKAEETTKAVNGCLKIAEDMREDATKTLVTLHHQGEQITRTHMTAADIDHDLSRGEKLLGSLGGIFSKTWKPKKSHPISGPVITRGEELPSWNELSKIPIKVLTSPNTSSSADESLQLPHHYCCCCVCYHICSYRGTRQLER